MTQTEFGYKYICERITDIEKFENKINDLRAEGYRIVGAPTAASNSICVVMEKTATSPKEYLPSVGQKDFTGEF